MSWQPQKGPVLADSRKTPVLLFQGPRDTNEFTVLPMCWPSSISPHSSLPASTFWNKMWEMGQFTAKGCFFLRGTDIDMEYRGYAEVDGERWGVWVSKKKRKMRDRKARRWHKYECHLREDRSAWMAFLAFSFRYTKKLEPKSGSWSFQSATTTRARHIFN